MHTGVVFYLISDVYKSKTRYFLLFFCNFHLIVMHQHLSAFISVSFGSSVLKFGNILY